MESPSRRPTGGTVRSEYTVFAQLLATAGIPLEESRVRQLARDVGLRTADGGLVTVACAKESIQLLLRLGHIQRVPEGAMHGRECVSGISPGAYGRTPARVAASLVGASRDRRSKPFSIRASVYSSRRIDPRIPLRRSARPASARAPAALSCRRSRPCLPGGIWQPLRCRGCEPDSDQRTRRGPKSEAVDYLLASSREEEDRNAIQSAFKT
jgi:hypothetical protein